MQRRGMGNSNRKQVALLLFLSVIFTTCLYGCGKSKTTVNPNETTKEQSVLATEGVTQKKEIPEGETQEKNISFASFDFDKNCERIEMAEGVYRLRREFDEYYGYAASLGENIVFVSCDAQQTNIDSHTASVTMELYSEKEGKVIQSEVVNYLASAYVYTSNQNILIADPLTYKICKYDAYLNIEETISIPNNMEDARFFSQDLRYVAGIGNEDYTNCYVYDLYDKKQISIDLGDKGEFSICGIVANDIVVMKCFGSEKLYYYYSIKNEKFVEADYIRSTGYIESYNNQYFSFAYDGAKSGFYYGDLDNGHKVLYCSDESHVWYYKTKELGVLQVDADANQITHMRYDLLNGICNQKVDISAAMDLNQCNIQSYYIDSYNIALIGVYDEQTKKTIFYAVDLNENTEETEKKEVFNFEESIVNDFGDLAPLRKKADLLEEKYDVVISIGEECRFGDTWGYHSEIDTNYDEIESALESLDVQLQVYPENFFKQLQIVKGEKVVFYLATNLTTSNEELMSTCHAFVERGDTYQYAVFDIADVMDTTVWHEVTHMMNNKLRISEGFDEVVFMEDWSSFNAPDFQWCWYDNYENGNMNIRDYLADGNMYFVKSYSMTSIEEDIATMMEAAIADYYPLTVDNANGKDPIWNKLVYYSKQIREYFDTTSWPEVLPWEKGISQRMD